jgi:hypothetical protein
MANISGVMYDPPEASSVLRWGEVGSSQQPLALSQPVPRTGAAITIGARRSTRRMGESATVPPMSPREGASGGIAYRIRLVTRRGGVRP